jgi:hypothetical protein
MRLFASIYEFFMQAGHCICISRSAGSESNRVFFVVNPVGTLVLVIGQRIMILDIDDYRPQSSSASRFTAGAFGFLTLSQSGERPRR